VQLLLLSTGGRPNRFLRHARRELRKFLAGCRTIGFVTAANLGDEAAYFRRARVFFRTIGVRAKHIRWQAPPKSLNQYDAIMVGGGNTYALLKRLRESGLLRMIRDAVRKGKPYVGASAGSNIAGPNACTTNDMPAYVRCDLRAMDLVPWNINPHYPRAPRAEKGRAKFSESRNQRIAEYHCVHQNPVVGIEEAACIRVDGDKATVLGTAFGQGRARWFMPDMKPQWVRTGRQLPLWGMRTRFRSP
jgi:dipeptidase E